MYSREISTGKDYYWIHIGAFGTGKITFPPCLDENLNVAFISDTVQPGLSNIERLFLLNDYGAVLVLVRFDVLVTLTFF